MIRSTFVRCLRPLYKALTIFESLQIALDRLNRSINAHASLVQAQIIAVGIAPCLIGVVAVITGTVFIFIFDNLFGLFLSNIAMLHQGLDTAWQICSDKDSHEVAAFSQHIVRATSDKNRVSLVSKVPYCFKLRFGNLPI